MTSSGYGCKGELDFTKRYQYMDELSQPHGIPIKVLTLQKGTCVFKGTPVKISSLINSSHFYVADKKTAQIYVNRNSSRPGYACTFQTTKNIKLVIVDATLIQNIISKLKNSPKDRKFANLINTAYPMRGAYRRSYHQVNKAISSIFSELFSNYDGTIADAWSAPGHGGQFHPEAVFFDGSRTLSPLACFKQGQLQENFRKTNFRVTGINWTSASSVKSKLLEMYDWVMEMREAGFNLIRCADNQKWEMYDTNSSVTFIAETWNWSNPNMPWGDVACKESNDKRVKFSPCTIGNTQDRIFWKIPGGLGELIVQLKNNTITIDKLRAFLYTMKFQFGKRKVFNHNQHIHWLHFKTDDQAYKYDVIVRLILLEDNVFNFLLKEVLSNYLNSDKDSILRDLAGYAQEYAGQHNPKAKTRILKIVKFYGLPNKERQVFINIFNTFMNTTNNNINIGP